MSIARIVLCGSLGLLSCAESKVAVTQDSPLGTAGVAVNRLQREAQAVRSLVHSSWGSEFLDASARLPAIPSRHVGGETIDELGYYYGGTDSPVFFARFLDLIAEGETRRLGGRRLLALSYESVGPLRMLAAAGSTVVGVSSSAKLRALYSQPEDQGELPLLGREIAGRLTLIFGQFPADSATSTAVGGGYDAVVARNVLRRLPPPALSAPAGAFEGISDAEYMRRLFDLLRPGGRLLVYNICAATEAATPPSGDLPDCRNPFSQAAWQAAGFRVRDYQRSDTAELRAFGQALGWTENRFSTYTLLERP